MQRSQAGYSLRVKPFPRKTASEAQVSKRSYVLQVQNAWHSLTSQQQSAWESFSSYAPSYCKKNSNVLLRGYTLFLRHNLLLMNANASLLSIIQYMPNNFQNPEGDLSHDISEFDYELYTPFDEANWAVLVRITAPHMGRNIGPSAATRVLVPTITSSSILHMFDAYTVLYGRCPESGEWNYVWIQFINRYMPVTQAAYGSALTGG
jgi:hypothetical protein